MEGPDEGAHSVSPVARFTTLTLADVPYVPTYSPLKNRDGLPAVRELRKFRSFLDEVVQVMDDCGIRPWTDDDEKGR
jgi:hypothetical protein